MNASDEERHARRGLACAIDPGDLRIGPLVAEHGAAKVWARLLRSGIDTAWSRRARALSLAAVEQAERACGARFIVPGDAEWPVRLGDLARCEPVQDAGGAPLGLWIRGDRSLADVVRTSVAIVGSRASTPYGERVAAELAAGLADARVGVVSGAAYGIDAAAHRGALAGEGVTVAALACGVDVPYPRPHEALLGQIARRGIVVSERPPGEAPMRRHFLTRNRLIAALTDGTVIVEAAHRSGARNTVSWANACARPVMAVPGPIGSVTSFTPHQLIRSGEAMLITDVAEIRELILPIGEVELPRVSRDRLLDTLTPEQGRVYEALPARGGRDAGEIALKAGLVMPDAWAVLGELAELGMAESDQTGRWRMGRRQDQPLLPAVRAGSADEEHQGAQRRRRQRDRLELPL